MFFSVKVPMKIDGKAYHTCICYAMTETIKATVERLVTEGKAEIYPEQRFFCNGKLIEKKKAHKAKAKVKKETVKEEPKVDETILPEEVVAPEIKEEDF